MAQVKINGSRRRVHVLLLATMRSPRFCPICDVALSSPDWMAASPALAGRNWTVESLIAAYTLVTSGLDWPWRIDGHSESSTLSQYSMQRSCSTLAVGRGRPRERQNTSLTLVASLFTEASSERYCSSAL